MTEFPLDPQQHPDLTDFIAELNKANVDYLVAGAWAVMAHSRISDREASLSHEMTSSA